MGVPFGAGGGGCRGAGARRCGGIRAHGSGASQGSPRRWGRRCCFDGGCMVFLLKQKMWNMSRYFDGKKGKINIGLHFIMTKMNEPLFLQQHCRDENSCCTAASHVLSNNTNNQIITIIIDILWHHQHHHHHDQIHIPFHRHETPSVKTKLHCVKREVHWKHLQNLLPRCSYPHHLVVEWQLSPGSPRENVDLSSYKIIEYTPPPKNNATG